MASTTDPTAAAPSYDPKVVGWIIDAAKRKGADPAAMLATSLQENGARGGLTPGDNGSSFGYFQMHRGGALGTHAPSWATTSAVADNRAGEFARLGVHGGKGAAAVQRPGDPAGYAQGVDSHLAQAKAIIAHYLGGTATRAHASGNAAPPAATVAPATPAPLNGGDDLVQSLIEANAQIAKLPGSSAPHTMGESFMQSILNQNSALAHVEAPTLPVRPEQAAAASAPPTVPSPPSKVKSTPPLQPTGKVVGGTPKIIGTPYHGTHTLGNWESDNAVDIALPVGTPIRAPASGIIGSQIGSLGAAAGSRFAGLRVHLKTGGNELYFAHLSRLTVKAGQRVQAGQIIGYSGSANGVAHLHLGAMNGNPGRYA